tara:strand:+ start:2411 stop:3415 length:1005 start_codon:yes stop_codon:yes gene_type:complete
MAKRKRLTPPREDLVNAPATSAGAFLGTSAPISHIAGDAAATSALREVAEEMTAARVEGRLVLRLALENIEDSWLVRDRIGTDQDALEVLKTSIRTHGQRAPIEVSDLGKGRYGLISGWRRLTALRELYEQTGEAHFATVTALLRSPETAGDAYVAMIEENEIRLGLSYFERARITAKSVEAGIYPDEQTALRALFASASRAKRSKIGSFLRIYHKLGNNLRFASALPERLGLTLVRALDDDPALAGRIAEQLELQNPLDAMAEHILLTAAVAPKGSSVTRKAKVRPVAEQIGTGFMLETHSTATEENSGKIILQGKGLTPKVLAELRAWLVER